MMEWKQRIFNQLRERNRQERDVYAEIIEYYNRVSENYSIILLRSTEQEREISSLREENTRLQDSSVSVVGPSVNDTVKKLEHDYAKAKDEVLTLHREKGEMTKELINLSRLDKERDEKRYSQDNKNQILTKENNTLKHRLEAAEEKLNVLQKANEKIRDEFQALELTYTQVERRNQELQAINTAIRKDMTAKVEGICAKLDEEVRNHEKQKTKDMEQKLDDAIKDITMASRSSLDILSEKNN